MGIRKYQRQIAKARLKAMGVKPSRLSSNTMPPRGTLRKLMQYRHGRAYLEMIRNLKAPVWQRVLWGDLSKVAFRDQMIEGQKIKKRKMVQDSMAKRRIRKVEGV